MSSPMLVLFPALIVILLLMPLVPALRSNLTGQSIKRNMLYNLCAFFGVALLMVLLPIGDLIAYAETGAEATEAAVAVTTGTGLGYIGAALAGGLSALGAGIAVASAAPAAIGAASEDPKSFGKSIIFVVLGEGVAIYGLLVAILIINKL